MDDKRGCFVGEDQFKKLSQSEQDRVEKLPTLGIGEVVEIKGVGFEVVKMLTRGRLHLKMVRREK